MPLDVFQGERERNCELLATEILAADIAKGGGGSDGDGNDFHRIVEWVVAQRGGRRNEVLPADKWPLLVNSAGAVVVEKGANETEREVTAGNFAGLIFGEIGVAIQVGVGDSRFPKPPRTIGKLLANLRP